MRGLFELLQTNISQSREKLYTSPRTFEPLSVQHREMMDGVLSGDPERARAAATRPPGIRAHLAAHA